jgi:proteasome lid subunit RPN8/RPN11
MKVTIALHHLAALQGHLEAVYPQEGCGLLLGTLEQETLHIHQVIAATNVWNHPEDADRSLHDRYEIDPREMLAAMKTARQNNLEIVGIYHSHPDHPASPSECDRSLAWSEYIYVICSVDSGSVSATTVWQLDDRHQFQSIEITVE